MAVALTERKGLLVEGMKVTPVLAWLKEDFGLGSGHAMAIFGALKDVGQPRLSNDERITAQFAGGSSVWQEPWDELWAHINEFGPDISVGATDTYLSLLHGTKKFAAVYPSAKRMDVGIKLMGNPDLSLSKGASPPPAPGTA